MTWRALFIWPYWVVGTAPGVAATVRGETGGGIRAEPTKILFNQVSVIAASPQEAEAKINAMSAAEKRALGLNVLDDDISGDNDSNGGGKSDDENCCFKVGADLILSPSHPPNLGIRRTRPRNAELRGVS